MFICVGEFVFPAAFLKQRIYMGVRNSNIEDVMYSRVWNKSGDWNSWGDGITKNVQNLVLRRGKGGYRWEYKC